MIALTDEIERMPTATQTGLAASIRDYRRSPAQPDLVALISDLNLPQDEIDQSLALLGGSARSASLIHVIAPQERTIDLRGPVELRDSESGRTISTTLTDERAGDYARRFAEFTESVERGCRREGIGYVRADTDVEPLDLLLSHARDAALAYA